MASPHPPQHENSTTLKEFLEDYFSPWNTQGVVPPFRPTSTLRQRIASHYPPQNAVTLQTFLIRTGHHALEPIHPNHKSQMSDSNIQTELNSEITNASHFLLYILETLNGDHRRGKGGW
jgi:hypothetical protein